MLRQIVFKSLDSRIREIRKQKITGYFGGRNITFKQQLVKMHLAISEQNRQLRLNDLVSTADLDFSR